MSPGSDRRALLQSAHATRDVGEDETAELDRVDHGTVPQAVDLRHGLLPRVRWSSLSYNTSFVVFGFKAGFQTLLSSCYVILWCYFFRPWVKF